MPPRQNGPAMPWNILLVAALLVSLVGPGPQPGLAAQAKILDGELLEEGVPAPAGQVLGAPPSTEQTVTLLKEFTVSLPIIPSTGVVWRVSAYDRPFLQLLRHRYQRPEPPRPSALGHQQFDFLPLKSGRTTIVFVAQPPLSRTVHQERQYLIIIR
jgi:hypothetical protein